MDLLTPSSPGVFQLCLSPLIAPGYLGEGCHASHQPSDASTPRLLILVMALCNLPLTPKLLMVLFVTDLFLPITAGVGIGFLSHCVYLNTHCETEVEVIFIVYSHCWLQGWSV